MFIPRSILGGVTGSGALACDPLPPTTAVSRYDEVFFEGAEEVFVGGRRQTRREQAMDERRLAQVIPDAAFRRQFQVRFPFFSVWACVWVGFADETTLCPFFFRL